MADECAAAGWPRQIAEKLRQLRERSLDGHQKRYDVNHD
jgi:hypothetical protein